MKPFLSELAAKVYAEHKRSLDDRTFVFPNRRAALFFRKHLSTLLEKPLFSPALITIEDFISSFSDSKMPDKLQLIHKLHAVYNTVLANNNITLNEPFEKFYFWGEMLLRDFEEADKYMVSADHLFKDLSHQKELDASFDFLTEEQLEFLKNFWANFEEKNSINKQRFLELWKKLPEVYHLFRDRLKKERLAYEGMLHRDVAENISHLAKTKTHNVVGSKMRHLCFVGFNALTKAEETILSFFVEQYGAKIYWDIDDYYINNERQEAARFFREYRMHPILRQTFPQDIPANFKSKKNIELYAAAQPVGQAKVMSQLLQGKLLTGYNPEETLIVLPDEKLLMPVLHGIAGSVEKMNVTMGFPLSATPLYNLVELLIELQINRKQDYYNHRQVVALLGHPYLVAADPAAAQAKRKEILEKNWVYVSENYLRSKVEIHRKVFCLPPRGNNSFTMTVLTYLRNIVLEVGQLRSVQDFDKEYCFHFITVLNNMEEVFSSGTVLETDEELNEKQTKPDTIDRDELKSFLRLFRQIVRAEKIPFRGEPLKGLQIMGVLETRNLDFKNVFILSLNEGAFPAYSSKGSFIPYNIRKAYGLPTVEQQDSMYAYLFYRILQRAENIFLFYNSETDELGQGEMSRYLRQIIFESGLQVKKHFLHNELQPHAIQPLTIQKDERVFNALASYCLGSPQDKKLSPSALNTYLECRLKFYFSYVAGIKEPREVEEDLDARVLGNFLHRVMEYFYQDIINKKGSPIVEAKDFEGYEIHISTLIDKAFIKNYGLDPDKKVVYEGQRLVVREIVKRFVDRIIKLDQEYAPFAIEALERNDLRYHMKVNTATVVLSGSIDRADKKGNVLRIIDYKTGKDPQNFADIPSLFERGKKRNKAAFQTFLYTLLYKHNIPSSTSLKLVPGLINRMNLFNDDFVFGLEHNNTYLEDATPMMDDYESRLKDLLEEIFDEKIPFDQTSILESCQYCSYRQICYR